MCITCPRTVGSLHGGDQCADVIREDPVCASSEGALDAAATADAPRKGEEVPLVRGGDDVASKAVMKDVHRIHVDRGQTVEERGRPLRGADEQSGIHEPDMRPSLPPLGEHREVPVRQPQPVDGAIHRSAVHDRVGGTGVGHVESDIDAGAAARVELIDGGHVGRELSALQRSQMSAAAEQRWVEQDRNPVRGQPDIALDAAAHCCGSSEGRKRVLLCP
jgi:hypothetical protein